MKSPILYHKTDLHSALIGGQAYNVDRFIADAPWVHATNARSEAFWSVNLDPYTYGEGEYARTYHPTLFPDWMLPLKAFTEELCGSRLDLCFLNRYDNYKQSLGWHADNAASQDMNAPIVVQSFGSEREIFFRPIHSTGTCAACSGSGRYDHDGSPKCGACGGSGKTPPDIEKQLLQNGSSLIMLPGMQLTHHHKIPRASDSRVGTRISLTWRKLAK